MRSQLIVTKTVQNNDIIYKDLASRFLLIQNHFANKFLVKNFEIQYREYNIFCRCSDIKLNLCIDKFHACNDFSRREYHSALAGSMTSFKFVFSVRFTLYFCLSRSLHALCHVVGYGIRDAFSELCFTFEITHPSMFMHSVKLIYFGSHKVTITPQCICHINLYPLSHTAFLLPLLANVPTDGDLNLEGPTCLPPPHISPVTSRFPPWHVFSHTPTASQPTPRHSCRTPPSSPYTNHLRLQPPSTNYISQVTYPHCFSPGLYAHIYT